MVGCCCQAERGGPDNLGKESDKVYSETIVRSFVS